VRQASVSVVQIRQLSLAMVFVNCSIEQLLVVYGGVEGSTRNVLRE
jgi:hypothetical protein